MCVIYEPASNRLGGGDHTTRHYRPYLGSQFSSFPSKVAVHTAVTYSLNGTWH